MRIAIPTRFAHRAGGVETYLEAVLPALALRGHEVSVWHEFEFDARAGTILPEGLAARHLGDGGAALRDLAAWQPDVIFSQGINAVELEAQMPQVAPLAVMLHAYNGTCISGTKLHAWPTPSVCTRPLGPGCLLHFHARRCGGLSPVTMLRDYRMQRTRQQVLAGCAALLSISDHMRQEGIAQGVAGERAHLIPAFAPAVADVVARSSTDSRVHVVFAGRFEPLKGPQLLIEAVGLLPASVRAGIAVTMVGDGREFQACAARAETLRSAGVGITLTGWRSQRACADIIRTADLLVVPSVWPEPFGLVGVEAAAAGVPALAFALGGIPEWLLDNRTGRLLAPPATAKSLAQGLQDCLADPARLHRWGRDAQRYASERTLERHVAALEDALQAAVGAGLPSGARS